MSPTSPPTAFEALRRPDPQERLSTNGDNLPDVIQYLKEQHPDQLEEICSPRYLQESSPAGGSTLSSCPTVKHPSGIKTRPSISRSWPGFASDGTLKMLSYLTVLYDPNPPQLVGIEEPKASTPGYCRSWPKNAGTLQAGPSFSSPPTHLSSSTASSPKRSGSSAATRRATPGRSGPPT